MPEKPKQNQQEQPGAVSNVFGKVKSLGGYFAMATVGSLVAGPLGAAAMIAAMWLKKNFFDKFKDEDKEKADKAKTPPPSTPNPQKKGKNPAPDLLTDLSKETDLSEIRAEQGTGTEPPAPETTPQQGEQQKQNEVTTVPLTEIQKATAPLQETGITAEESTTPTVTSPTVPCNVAAKNNEIS